MTAYITKIEPKDGVKNCGKCQEACWFDLFWATCVDGEPIEEPQPRLETE